MDGIELNTIYNEDCLETMRRMPDGFVDCVVTDPPYEINAKSGGGIHKNRMWMKNVAAAGLDKFEPIRYMDEVYRVCKPFNAYVFCSRLLLGKYIAWIESKKLKWNLLIYAKTNPIPTKNNNYLGDKEFCFFIKESGAYFNNDRPFDEYRTVQFTSIGQNEFHPTQKDVTFIKLLIHKSSEPGAVIYDPFMGSGTTARACKDLGRNYIGSEISKEYCEIAEKRLKQEVLL